VGRGDQWGGSGWIVILFIVGGHPDTKMFERSVGADYLGEERSSQREQ
jgi:hypothetical protein